MTTNNSNNNNDNNGNINSSGNNNSDDYKTKDLKEFKAKTIVWYYPRILYGGTMKFKITYGDITQTETHTF